MMKRNYEEKRNYKRENKKLWMKKIVGEGNINNFFSKNKIIFCVTFFLMCAEKENKEEVLQ